MSEVRSNEVVSVLEGMSKLLDFDFTGLDIKDEYTLNIFLRNPSSFLEDKELIKKVEGIKNILYISTEIIKAEGVK